MKKPESIIQLTYTITNLVEILGWVMCRVGFYFHIIIRNYSLQRKRQHK